jgi:hypothetical protein
LWIWISLLYLLRCVLGCFVCFISGLQLSIDRHIKLSLAAELAGVLEEDVAVLFEDLV